MFNIQNKQEQGIVEIKAAVALNPFRLNDVENWKFELLKTLKTIDSQATVISTNSEKYVEYIVSFYGYQYSVKVSKISNVVVDITILKGLKSGFPRQFLESRIEDKLAIFM